MNTFQAWLTDWAAWHEAQGDYASGYASSTPVWRAMMARRITEFASCIPAGAEPPRDLARLCYGLNAVKAIPEHAGHVTAMQRYYIIRHYHGQGQEAARLTAEEYRIAPSTAYEWKRSGERAVEQWLRAN